MRVVVYQEGADGPPECASGRRGKEAEPTW